MFARLIGASAASLFVLVPAVAIAAWPLDSEIEPALSLDVTPAGFDAISEIVNVLVPETIAVPGFSDQGQRCEYSLFGQCLFWSYKYKFDISNVSVAPAIDLVTITPATGQLDLDASLDIAVGATTNPMKIYVDATIAEIIGIGGLDIDQTCYAYVKPFPVDLSGDVKLQVIPDGSGGRALDATVSPLVWDWDLTGNDIVLWGSDCVVADVRNFFTWFGFDPFDLLLGEVEGAVDDAIQDLRGEIEAQLEDVFASASIEEEFAVGETTMTVGIEPSDVTILPSGMRIDTAGRFGAPVHPCVADWLGSGSLATPSDVPALGSAATSVPWPHHVGVFVDDDFVNNGLYGAWAGGLLCYTLTEGGAMPINTTLLGLLSSEAFAPLFPETKPMIIQTRPRKAPEASTSGPSDLNVAIRELGLDFYADLDYRMTRVIGADMKTDVGVDFGFDASTGELLVDVLFSSEDVDVTISHNDYARGQEAALEQKFGDLFDTVVDPLIGGFIDDIAFAMPAFEGIGLTGLHVAPSGPSGDRFGMYAQTGAVTYSGAGCDAEGGCSGGGCTGAPARPVWLALPVVVALLRRRATRS